MRIYNIYLSAINIFEQLPLAQSGNRPAGVPALSGSPGAIHSHSAALRFPVPTFGIHFLLPCSLVRFCHSMCLVPPVPRHSDDDFRIHLHEFGEQLAVVRQCIFRFSHAWRTPQKCVYIKQLEGFGTPSDLVLSI